MNRALTYVRMKLQDMGVAITRAETLRCLFQDHLALLRTKDFLQFLGLLNTQAIAAALELFPQSRGENFQDVFAMLVLDRLRNGFFVEFGATDGVTGSNSYMLEN